MIKKILSLLLIFISCSSMEKNYETTQELISKIKWMLTIESKNPKLEEFQNLTLVLANRLKETLGKEVINKFNETWIATDAYACVDYMHEVRGDILQPCLTKYSFVGTGRARAIFNDEVIDFYISDCQTVSMHPIAFCALVFHHYNDEWKKLLIEGVTSQ